MEICVINRSINYDIINKFYLQTSGMQNQNTALKNLNTTKAWAFEHTPENKKTHPYNQAPDYKPKDSSENSESHRIVISDFDMK